MEPEPGSPINTPQPPVLTATLYTSSCPARIVFVSSITKEIHTTTAELFPATATKIWPTLVVVLGTQGGERTNVVPIASDHHDPHGTENGLRGECPTEGFSI